MLCNITRRTRRDHEKCVVRIRAKYISNFAAQVACTFSRCGYRAATNAFVESNFSSGLNTRVFDITRDCARCWTIDPIARIETKKGFCLLVSLRNAVWRLTTSMKRATKKTKQTNPSDVRIHADSLGVDARVLGRAIRRNPSLRSRLGALASKAGVCARILGVKRSAFVRMALVEPDLIDVPVATLLANIREGSKHLRVSAERFKQLVLKAPVLLSLTPQEWKSRISCLARTLHCEEERVRRLIARVPEIIGWPISRWQQKRREIGAALCLNIGQMNRMILRDPGIINSRPATLKAHAKRLTSVLSLSTSELASVMVRLPTLLKVNPDLLASKLPKIKAIGRLYNDMSVRDIIVMLPAALGYSHERLK